MNPKPIRHRGMVLRWNPETEMWVSSVGPIRVFLCPYEAGNVWGAYVSVREEGAGDATRRTHARAIDAALRRAERRIQGRLVADLRLRNRLRKMRGAP
jgi:hypothetical protein